MLRWTNLPYRIRNVRHSKGPTKTIIRGRRMPSPTKSGSKEKQETPEETKQKVTTEHGRSLLSPPLLRSHRILTRRWRKVDEEVS